MTQENKETSEQEFLNAEIEGDEKAAFDVRQIRKPLAPEGCGRFPNGVRPMIQFVPGKQDTTESRFKDVREQMTYTKARNTIRRPGWYFTEPYAPCGKQTIEYVKQSIKDIFGA